MSPTRASAVHAEHEATARRVEQAAGQISAAAVDAMNAQLPWYRELPAERRSLIGLIVTAGLTSFTTWLRDPAEGAQLPTDVFAAAPPEMARAVSLPQTVELVRLTVEVLESQVGDLAAPGEADWLRTAVLRYSRELAFAAAQVYATAAEARGAWDARLEALIVDAVLRGESDEALNSRAAAVGWSHPGPVTVVAGHTPDGDPADVVRAVQRAARHADLDVLVGVQGERLLVILGGVGDLRAAGGAIVDRFGPGPVVVGPLVTDLAAATGSAAAALSGLRAVAAWPAAPRPVEADDLLPERALAGDAAARRALVEDFYEPLAAAGSSILETVSTFLELAGSLEATARALFVHPNTVRYRLRRAAEITGAVPGTARGAYALRLALTLGRLP
ncbi:PucR family transcriptional regulator [Sporichthya polymorpha]|uniref:PucR family transcriptional regulator n=1 Tax=Sporichthya polymorpha TaxID=35751 RepID=UPI00037F9DD1|nr:helix-turn-helix domain-containing protein [Sporichthya polymorpha]